LFDLLDDLLEVSKPSSLLHKLFLEPETSSVYSSLQNIPDEMGSNASLSSASDLVAKNGRQYGKKFNCAFVAASLKYHLSLSYRSGIFQQYSYFSEMHIFGKQNSL
jgi:hypothetical protein